MRALLVLALLGSAARAEPMPHSHIELSIDGWSAPAPDAQLPAGVQVDLDTLVLPASDLWLQFNTLAADQTCADFLRLGRESGTRIENWAGYPTDLPDRVAYEDTGVSGCLTAGGRTILFRFLSPGHAALDLAIARGAVTALRDALVKAAMHLALPASGLAIDLPTHAFTLARDGDADVLVHTNGTTRVKILGRPGGCATLWPVLTPQGHLHDDRRPNGSASAFGVFRLDDPREPHHAFLCADRDARSFFVEIVEPLAAREDVDAALAALARALPPDSTIHVAPPLPVHEGFAYLMVLARVYIEGGIARTSFASASGGRLGVEAVAGGAIGTHLALGFGAAGGVDEDLHASFDSHIKLGFGRGLGEHSIVFLMGLAGFARSATHGDGLTGGYLGGELDLRLDYVELAGGASIRGQHARVELIKRRREQSFGVGAGGEWIHDGQVQTFGLFLAGVL